MSFAIGNGHERRQQTLVIQFNMKLDNHQRRAKTAENWQGERVVLLTALPSSHNLLCRPSTIFKLSPELFRNCVLHEYNYACYTPI